jgi:hypothetical protein
VSSTDSTTPDEPTDSDVPEDSEESEDTEEWVRPIDKFRRTAAGSVMAAGLLGIRDVIEGRPQKEEAAIISEAPTAPPPDNIEVVLDLEHPERSVVYLHRPPESAPED